MHTEIRNGKLRSPPQEIIQLSPTANDLYGYGKGEVLPAAFRESDSRDKEHSCSEMCQPELCSACDLTISRCRLPPCCICKPAILNENTSYQHYLTTSLYITSFGCSNKIMREWNLISV
jgi:hypothetical protein